MTDRMLAQWLRSLPGGDAISSDFCNEPVSVTQSWLDEPVAAVLLCGLDAGHQGHHDAKGWACTDERPCGNCPRPDVPVSCSGSGGSDGEDNWYEP